MALPSVSNATSAGGGEEDVHVVGQREAPEYSDHIELPPASLVDDPVEGVPEQHSPKRPRSGFTGRPRPAFRQSPLIRAHRPSHEDEGNNHARHSLHHAHERLNRVISQVQNWVDAEKAKRAGRRSEGSHKVDVDLALEKLQQILHLRDEAAAKQPSEHEGSEPFIAPLPQSKRSSHSLRKLGRAPGYSSDGEHDLEHPAYPPSAAVVLDNSKTLSYASPSTTDLTRQRTNAEAWHIFKTEIVRLAHTLKLTGWRRVPIEQGDNIDVQRLSGALTNAVYVVSPPSELPESRPSEPSSTGPPRRAPPKLILRIYGPQVEHLIDREGELAILRRLARKNIGPKLLGTFTNGRFEEYLNAKPLTANEIRDPVISNQIAKRMRELHDGIDLLPQERDAGPFVWQNWDKWKERCEEVIQWLDEQIIAYHEAVIAVGGNSVGGHEVTLKRSERWKARGLVCGVEWSVFRSAVRAYRAWLEAQYGGLDAVKDSLVFAHNDTQYGNLLRLQQQSDDKVSHPLLAPANQHRQLVVIDFEYANANTRGLEFANHFTEWCYDYHGPEPYRCRTERYPGVEEQTRFVRQYVTHTPHFIASQPGQTPVLSAAQSPDITPMQPLKATRPTRPTPDHSMSSFSLDRASLLSSSIGSSAAATATGPSGSLLSSSSSSSRVYEEEERQHEEALEREIKKLMHETRLWRVANSAMWVAWGIVQAKVPGMKEALEKRQRAKLESKQVDSGKFEIWESEDGNGGGGGRGCEQEPEQLNQLVHDTATEERHEERDDEDDDEEFDYLAYAQQRALFFWGDVLSLGLVKEEELPQELVKNAKRVEY